MSALSSRQDSVTVGGDVARIILDDHTYDLREVPYKGLGIDWPPT